MDQTDRNYQIGSFILIPKQHELLENGESVELSRKFFDVLLFLVRSRDRAVSHDEIKNAVWGSGEKFSGDGSLGNAISKLRSIFGSKAIKNFHGYGYRFVAKVTEISPDTGHPDEGLPADESVQPDARQATKPLDPYSTIKPLPLNYVDRPEELAQLRDLILGKTRTVALNAVQGMGGIGKTELARALCHDQMVRDAFTDGIVWIDVGRESGRTLLDRLKETAEALNAKASHYTSSNCELHYRTLVANKAVLIVLDNVWVKSDVEPFLTDSVRCRVLFTTRNTSIAGKLGAEEFSTNLLDVDQAWALLAKCSAREIAMLPGPAQEIIRECGYLPLGISELGSALKGKPDERWWDILEKLRKAQIESLYAPTKVSVDVLGEEHPEIRPRYLLLAVLLEDMTASVPLLQMLWAVDAITVRDTVDELEDRSLAKRVDGGIWLHDLQLDYVRSEYPDQEALNLIHQALRLSSHVVGRNPAQFASQITGRLLSCQDHEIIRKFLFTIRISAPHPWLRPIWSALTAPGEALIRVLEDRMGIRGVAVSADGQRAISASDDHTLKVWDIDSGCKLHTLHGHTETVVGVAMNRDGRLAVSASDDHTLKVWDVNSGCELHTLKGHTAAVSGVAVSADGRRAVSASYDHTLKVWDVDGGSELYTLKGHTAAVSGVALSADGRWAVSTSLDRTFKVWDVDSRCELYTLEEPFSLVRGVAVSANGRQAVSALNNHTLKVWDVESGLHVHSLRGHVDWVRGVAMSEDGRLAVSVSDDYTLKLWDVDSGKELYTLGAPMDEFHGVAVSSNGRRVVSAADNGLKVWDVESGRQRHSLTGHTDWIVGVAVSADGRLAVSASYDHTLKVWDVNGGRQVHTLEGHTAGVSSVAVSADGRRAVSASYDHTLKVWDLVRAQKLRTLKGHSDWVNGVALSADGRLAVSASNDQTLKVWDVDRGRKRLTLRGHCGDVNGIALSADGRLAVSASADRTLKVWDVNGGQHLQTLEGHTAGVVCVAVSADGRLAVSGSFDQTLKVWDVDRGHTLHTLKGHTDSVNGVALSADSRLAVSVSDDRSLKVWDIASGNCLATFACDYPAEGCAFASGRTIIACDVARRVYLLAFED